MNMWQDACRTCLKVDKNASNIFQQHKNNKLISELLTEFTTVQMQEDDGLPQNICSNCLEKVNTVCDFKTMALETNTRLQKLRIGNDSGNQCGDDILKSDPITTEDSVISIKSKKKDLTCNNFDEKLLKMKKASAVGGSDHQSEEKLIEPCEKVISQKENAELDDDFNDDDGRDLFCDSYSNSSDEGLKQNTCRIDAKSANHKQDKEITEDDHKMDSTIKSLISEYDHLKETLTRDEKSKAKLFCKICNKTVGFKYYFSIHLREHIGELPFECDTCKKRFPVKTLLKAHKKKHSNYRPFKCETCGMSFKILATLQRHKVVHETALPYKCKICNKTFKADFYLKNHLTTHQTGPEKLYICEICGKSLTSAKNAILHRTIHDPVDSFSCAKCEKAFKNKRRLKLHMRTHSDVKSYVCSYCGKGFKKLDVLKNHTRIHTGEKPYSCKVCAKSFRGSGTLHRHMRIHTGEKPYNCEKCSTIFRYSYELKSHMKSSHPDKIL